MSPNPTPDTYLLFRAAGRICAISAVHVDETMRPMSLRPINDAPGFVAGLSVIRGMACPVLDLRKFFQGDAEAAPRRLIAIRVDAERRVALLVDDVLGHFPAHILGFQPLPPVLRSAQTEVINSLAVLDGQLLQVLESGKLVPDSLWASAALAAGVS